MRTEGGVGKEGEVLDPKIRGNEGRVNDRETPMGQGSQGLSKKEEDPELVLDPGKEKAEAKPLPKDKTLYLSKPLPND